MLYKLVAYDGDHNTVMEQSGLSEGAAYMGFDIWCDPTLDETGTIATVNLIDINGQVVLSENIR